MKAKFFRHKNIEREYVVFGNGPRILYAFHGFGRSAQEWVVFEEWLKTDFTVYSFYDIFHGKSKFLLNKLEKEPLMKLEICEFFAAFAKDSNHSEVSLMAYSSGARTALTLVEDPPFKLKDVWLFAPDGIKISFWNKLFCRSKWIQKIFRRIVNKPFLFFYLTRTLSKMHLLNRSLSSFVLFNMRSKFKREQVYNYWMTYRLIVPSMNKVIASLIKNSIKLHLIIGRKDTVIDAKTGRKLIKQLNENADLTILESGHQLIEKKHLDVLMKKFPLK